jgi:hypothetical protein
VRENVGPSTARLVGDPSATGQMRKLS